MREPDLHVDEQKAWQLEVGAHVTKKDHEASLAEWLVYHPHAHPMWSYYAVGLVHLREIEGVKPPKLQYPGAEYELYVLSLNPEHGDPDPDNPPWHHLSPPDLIFQFHGVTDAQAAALCDKAVDVMVNGMSPDSDYRAWWKQMLTNSVDHITTGHLVGSA